MNTKEGNCYYCGKPVNNLACNPSEWGIPLCHKDEPGKVKTHHIGCVSKRLAENEELKNVAKSASQISETQMYEIAKLQNENEKLKDCLKEAIDLMEDTISGEYKPDSFTTQPWKRALMMEEKDK